MKILQPMLMEKVEKEGLDHFDIDKNGIANAHNDNTGNPPLKSHPRKFAKLGFFGMKSVHQSDKSITKKWIENIQDHRAEKFVEINDAIPMHFQFCEIFNTTLVIHIHCRGEKRWSTMIFASLKNLEVAGDLIQCRDTFGAQSFEEFPHQILAHQPN